MRNLESFDGMGAAIIAIAANLDSFIAREGQRERRRSRMERKRLERDSVRAWVR